MDSRTPAMLADMICPSDLRFLNRPRRVWTVHSLLTRICLFVSYATFIYVVGSGPFNVILMISYLLLILFCVQFARIMFFGKKTRLEDSAYRVRVLVGSLDLPEYDLAVKKLFIMAEDCLDRWSHGNNRYNPCTTTEPVSKQAKEDSTTSNIRPTETGKLFHVKDTIPIIGRQTFPQWKVAIEMGSLFTCRSKHRQRTLFLQPIGEFPEHIRHFRVGDKPLFRLLQDFASAYFTGMRVEILDEVNADSLGCMTRYHKITGKKQILVSDVQSKLSGSVKKHSKHDYIVGITWTDLYPSEDLNFVLGEASYKDKCAVVSFGRYEPRRYQGNKTGDDGITAIDGEILWRLIKVLSHETCHVFGFAHCVFFDCAMNESSTIDEAMLQPLFLCPICLRKLQHALGFDIRLRYNNLTSICQLIQLGYPTSKMAEALTWLDNCSIFLNTIDGKDMV